MRQGELWNNSWENITPHSQTVDYQQGIEQLVQPGEVKTNGESGDYEPSRSTPEEEVFQQTLWREERNKRIEAVMRDRSMQVCERLQHSGVSLLSNVELLALALGIGSKEEKTVGQMQKLLEDYSLAELTHTDFGELCWGYGIGEAKAAQLQAVLEVSRRLTLPSTKEKYTILAPQDAANLVMSEMAHLDHEELRVLLLDTKNGVVANLLLYQGSINSSVLRVAEIFRPAITRKCAGIVVCHNHPSGNVTPSPEDIAMTNLMLEAAKLLDIELVDHIIIGDHSFLSLKERLMWS